MTTWNEAKRKENVAKHGVDLARAEHFEWETAFIEEDRNPEYGEHRERAIGFIGVSLYVYVYTLRDEEDHAISLRKAEKTEVRRYAQNI